MFNLTDTRNLSLFRDTIKSEKAVSWKRHPVKNSDPKLHRELLSICKKS